MIPQGEACALAPVSARVSATTRLRNAVARGYTSRRTPSTTHLRHVFAKLGVSNQASLAAVVHHSIE
jgi:hypothetical protein